MKNLFKRDVNVEVKIVCPGCTKCSHDEYRILDAEFDMAGELTDYANRCLNHIKFLACTRLSREQLKWFINEIEFYATVDEGSTALSLLKMMFVGAGLEHAVSNIDAVIDMCEESPELYDQFLEYLFEDEVIDHFLVDNWMDEWSDEEDEEVQDDCDM